MKIINNAEGFEKEIEKAKKSAKEQCNELFDKALTEGILTQERCDELKQNDDFEVVKKEYFRLKNQIEDLE